MSGGAGGKGTWGKLGEVYDDDGHTYDHRDPNYDSEEEVVSVHCTLLALLHVLDHAVQCGKFSVMQILTHCMHGIHAHIHSHALASRVTVITSTPPFSSGGLCCLSVLPTSECRGV